MTTKLNDRFPESEQLGGDTMVRACEACGHDSSSHDATATRFCRASHDRKLDRGCICRVAEPTRRSGAPMYGLGRFSNN
ncbi:RGCVC family protein [Pseudonocardia sp. Cha107L01]|uniref:RGCVC family protein n=1 Tax=Pseudonocardia sp. Cha107L01 TaxID=3457576 RepID=UPI00403E699E